MDAQRGRQLNGQADRQIERDTSVKTDKQMERETNRQMFNGQRVRWIREQIYKLTIKLTKYG